MRLIISKWNDVDDVLPGDDDYKAVRCINSDAEYDFYFMAYYYEKENSWEFFDDEYNNIMKVTHWMKPLKIKEK